MLINISVNFKYGCGFVVTCHHYCVHEDFINFKIDDFTICSVYIPDILSMFSYEYLYVDNNLTRVSDLLFDNGKVVKVV